MEKAEIDGESSGMINLTFGMRLMAYLMILVGYFFYCYNFLLPGYVRPYLISNLHFSLGDTANLTVAQNIGITAGALMSAGIISRFGRKWCAGTICVGAGLLTLGCMFIQSPFGWLILRGGICIFLGGYYVAAVTFTVSLFKPQWRAKIQAINSGMFSVAEIALGAFGALMGDKNWFYIVVLGAFPPMILGLLMFRFMPSDKSENVAIREEHKGSWSEMFSPKSIRISLSCMIMAGANFTGYQLFTEFVTLYLKQNRGFDAHHIGTAFSLIGLGSLIGGFFWAWIADRYGRRMPGFGFVGVALAISFYLSVPNDPNLIKALGFCYGFCLSCSYSWGIWFTEIFPPHLKAYAASLLHGGHIISIIAPFGITYVAHSYGLSAGMAMAPLPFIIGAILWATLPETLDLKEKKTTNIMA